MKFDSLREFVDAVDKAGELKRVEGADWNLEIGGLTELVAEKKGPMLLFDHIKGYPAGFRVLTNPFTNLRRTGMVLGLPEDLGGLEMLKAWKKRLTEFRPVPPIEVKNGPVKQNILTGKDVDLYKLPAPKWHELDGGRYLGTGWGVITRDPEEGWVNLGAYRGMIQTSNKITVKINVGKHGRIMMDKYHAKGQPCPVAAVVGAEPSIFAAACDMGVKWGTSEYDFAGWMRRAPVEVVKGEFTDLPIPANAEIVIEGEIPPPPFEKLQEGPFGEWHGYFADTTCGAHPIMTVKAILHRNDPIILGVPPLKPPIPYDFAIPKGAAAVWGQLEGADIPGIKGVWYMSGHTGPFIIVISIKQEYPGQAKQAAVVATACRAGTYGGRVVIVVDDDIDITNADEVMWAVSTRCRVEKDIEIIKDLWTCGGDPPLDPANRAIRLITNCRVLINATRPWERVYIHKDFPPVNRFSQKYREQFASKWSELLASITC